MKVREVMTSDVQVCSPETNLASATELMWNADCGALPVVDDGKVIGIVTDRDLLIALGTRDQRASEARVRDVLKGEVETCQPDADIHTALSAMRRAKVRRLPIIEDGKLKGILTLDDIVEAVDRKDYEEVVNTMKAVCEHRGRRMPVAVS